MRKKFGSYMMEAIAAISALFTIISVLFEIKVDFTCATICIAVIFVIAVLYAICQTISKRKIEITIQPQLKLTVEQGNLFKKKGVILIPVNEYFDTHVGDGVINEGSIHGIFINTYFRDRINELDEKIEKALDGVKYTNINQNRKVGKQKCYSLGTCASIRDGENIYILFAFTRFDDNNTASVEMEEYAPIINEVIKFAASKCELRPVYMPIIGTGLSRINLPNQQILHYLVDTIQFMPSTKIPGGLHVEILSNCKAGVNLNKIEDIFKTNI